MTGLRRSGLHICDCDDHLLHSLHAGPGDRGRYEDCNSWLYFAEGRYRLVLPIGKEQLRLMRVADDDFCHLLLLLGMCKLDA